MSNWAIQRIELYPSYNLRRVLRAGWVRDGNHPSKRIGGVYLRLPSRIYQIVKPSRFSLPSV